MNEMTHRRHFAAQTGRAILFAGLATLLPTQAQPAQAQQSYPNRPVRLIIPFGPGGIADITSRLVAERLGERLGQRFVIENQPGAGGLTAARSALAAPPDGYTLALLTNGTAISVSLFKSLPFDPRTDFVPVSSFAYFDFVFATNAGQRYRSLAEVIAAARERPGALNIGTINVGSSQNLSAELFKSTAGVAMTIVPYRTTPEVLVALLRNDIDLMIENFAALKSPLAEGKIRAVATSGSARSPVLPDVPTVKEGGVAGFEVNSWNGLFAPAKTPPEIVGVLNSALREVLGAADPGARRGSPSQFTGRDRRAAAWRYREMDRGDRARRHSAAMSFALLEAGAGPISCLSRGKSPRTIRRPRSGAESSAALPHSR